MTSHYSRIAFTPSVKAQQELNGSRAAYAAHEIDTTHGRDMLGPDEASFIMAQDSFYMASVSETGWPYIQHRGGPAGFVRVLNNRQIAFADFRGNRKYISLGNIAVDDRVSLFFMDYARKARIKIMGQARAVDLAGDPELASALALLDYKAKPERAIVIDIEAFDWNCPKHITPRYTEEQVRVGVSALQDRIAALEAELAILKSAKG